MVRRFMFGIAGLVLILTAIDIVWAHRVAEPPDTTAEGVLTSRGEIDRRQDLMWGSLFLVVGSVVTLASISGLLIRRSVFEMSEDGVSIRLLSGSDMMFIPFHRILMARSATDDSPGAAIRARQLLIAVDDPARFPDQLWGAEWEGNVLRVDTDGWNETAEEVALRIDLEKARAEYRERVAANARSGSLDTARDEEPPTW